MLKEALKWVADHTGISWILGKLSSGWKWLFSSKTDATEISAPKQPEEEKPAKQLDPPQTLILKAENKRLYLNLTKEIFEEYKGRENSQDEIHIFIEHEGNKFCLIGTLDEEKRRIIIRDIHDIYHGVNNDKVIEMNNGVNKVEIRGIPICEVNGITFSPPIRALSILEKNAHGEYVDKGSILNMVAAAVERTGVVVSVLSEQSVANTTTPEQPEVSNDNPVGATQPATPEQPNNAPFVDQTITPEQQPKVSNDNPVVDQTTMPKQPNEEQPAQPNNAAPVVDVIRNIGHFRVEGDDLVLSLTKEEFEKCKGSKYLYIKYDGIEHRVTGRYDNNNYNMHVTSIAKIATGVLYEFQNIAKDMKDKLKKVAIIDVESVSTAYSGKSLHVVQCPPLVEGYIRIDDDKLIFVIKSNSSNRYEGYINPANKAEHLFFIQCGGKEYRITGILDDNSVIINSIVEVKDGIVHKNDVLCPADHMETIKKNLELSSDQLLLVDGTRLSIAFIKIQQNGEPKEERFEVRRATEEEIAAGRAAREAALNGESDSMTESTASFRTVKSTPSSMTASTASFMTATSTLSSTDTEIKKDVQDVVAGMVNKVVLNSHDQSIHTPPSQSVTQLKTTKAVNSEKSL